MTQPISFLVDPAQPGAPIVLGNAARRVPRLTRSFGSLHGALLAFSRGRLASRWFGARILVLETVGRRTGQPRSTPLVYLPDGDDLVVVAANAGARRAPRGG